MHCLFSLVIGFILASLLGCSGLHLTPSDPPDSGDATDSESFGTETEPVIDHDSNEDMDGDTDSETDDDHSSSTDTDTYTDTDTDTEYTTETDGRTETDAVSNTDTDVDPGSEDDARIGTDSTPVGTPDSGDDTGFASDTDSAATDLETDTDSESITDMSTDADTGSSAEDSADTDSGGQTDTEDCDTEDDRSCGFCGNDCTQENQVCDGSGHCVDCMHDGHCQDDPPACKVYQCSDVGHTCELQSVTSLTACETSSGESGYCVSGSCVSEIGKRIGAGDDFACALKSSGEPVCWGDGLGRGAGAPVVSFVSLSVGTNHACGVRVDGRIQCWGDNSFGQSTPPQAGDFILVAAGNDHTCALNTHGEVECWGANDSGQSSAPQGPFSVISAGYSFTCGILASDGTVDCWGWADGRTSAPNGVAFDSISLGGGHTCGVRQTDRQMECWGLGVPGPNVLPPSGEFIQVGLGPATAHSCGIRSDGQAVCWGRGLPVDISPPSVSFRDLAAGDAFTCGISRSGRIECWGDNDSSALVEPEGDEF